MRYLIEGAKILWHEITGDIVYFIFFCYICMAIFGIILYKMFKLFGGSI